MTTEELIAARRAEPWREALRKSKKNTERTALARVKMSELNPAAHPLVYYMMRSWNEFR